jgi:hypothetical protein
LLHEIWVERDDDPRGLTSLCLAGPMGDAHRALLAPGARMIGRFRAGSHYEAMSIYYAFMGWGVCSTCQPQDHEPYSDEWAALQGQAGS